jgi:hypothetical protein
MYVCVCRMDTRARILQDGSQQTGHGGKPSAVHLKIEYIMAVESPSPVAVAPSPNGVPNASLAWGAPSEENAHAENVQVLGCVFMYVCMCACECSIIYVRVSVHK